MFVLYQKLHNVFILYTDSHNGCQSNNVSVTHGKVRTVTDIVG